MLYLLKHNYIMVVIAFIGAYAYQYTQNRRFIDSDPAVRKRMLTNTLLIAAVVFIVIAIDRLDDVRVEDYYQGLPDF